MARVEVDVRVEIKKRYASTRSRVRVGIEAQGLPDMEDEDESVMVMVVRCEHAAARSRPRLSSGPRQVGTDVRSKNGHFRDFRVHRIWVTFVYMRIGLANSGHFRVHSRSDIAGDYDLIRSRGGRASCT